MFSGDLGIGQVSFGFECGIYFWGLGLGLGLGLGFIFGGLGLADCIVLDWFGLVLCLGWGGGLPVWFGSPLMGKGLTFLVRLSADTL